MMPSSRCPFHLCQLFCTFSDLGPTGANKSKQKKKCGAKRGDCFVSRVIADRHPYRLERFKRNTSLERSLTAMLTFLWLTLVVAHTICRLSSLPSKIPAMPHGLMVWAALHNGPPDITKLNGSRYVVCFWD